MTDTEIADKLAKLEAVVLALMRGLHDLGIYPNNSNGYRSEPPKRWETWEDLADDVLSTHLHRF